MSKRGTFDETAISMSQIAGELGGSDEVAEYWTRKLKIAPVEDWRGARSVKVADAAQIVAAYRAARDEHDRAFHGYLAFVRERKEARAQAKLAEIARHRRDAQTSLTESRRRSAARRATELEAEYARMTAEADAERGPSFEDWKRTAGAA